ncbi:hypothetical protein HDU67_006892 [Dinochytrium kinnereticum]|nr:hypothetical protein HDU67_006892 [Dinochytrium kinnereticum]
MYTACCAVQTKMVLTTLWYNKAPKSDPRKIAQTLKDRGYKVWLDVNELRAGKDLHAQLAAALEKGKPILAGYFLSGLRGKFEESIALTGLIASVAVVCISDEYIQSKNCNLEVSYICDLSLPIIQAVVGKAENNSWRKSAIKFKIGSPLYIDFRQEPDTFEDKFQELLHALHDHGVQPMQSPPQPRADSPANDQTPTGSPLELRETSNASTKDSQAQTRPTTSGEATERPLSPPVEEDPLAGLSIEERLLALSASGDVKQLKKLLTTNRVNVETKGANGWTPLNSAAYNGHLEAVNMLMKAGARVDTQSSTGWTPLASAALTGHLDVVQFLVMHNADMEAMTIHKWTPLYSASYSGHTEVVVWLISQGANVNAANDCGWYPLSSAANSGHIDAVKALVEAGHADLECRNDDGSTPLFLAAMNNHLEVVKYLITNGADPNALTNMHLTPLHAAASLGFIEIVSFLIREAGVALHMASSHGWTPLHAGCFSGHLEVVKVLYDCGLRNVEAKTDDGCTPLYLAASKNYVDIMEYLKSIGCSKDVVSKKGWTPLMAAAAGGHLQAVEWLIEAGTHVNVADNDGKTSLHLAVENQHADVVQYLLENSCSIAACDLKDASGTTPLMLAATLGDDAILEILLEKGANRSARNNDGKTAQDLAIAGNKSVAVEVLASKSLQGLRRNTTRGSKKVHPRTSEGDRTGRASGAGASYHVHEKAGSRRVSHNSTQKKPKINVDKTEKLPQRNGCTCSIQ